MSRHAASRLSRSWWQRLALLGGGLLATLCLAAASFVGYVYWKTGRFARVDVPLDAVTSRDQPRNYLVIGSDSRENVDPDDPDAGAFLGPDSPTGKRSDTILLVRIDPVVGSVQMVSFPRDLYVPIFGTTGRDRINSAYGRGRDALIETIRRAFGVEIHHYIEVDFSGFKGLVGAVGGVPMWFETPMRDFNTGLDIPTAGCVSLDGDQALAFARSRHLEYQDGRGSWHTDPTGDLGRITRQQIFVRKALAKGLTLDVTDLPTFTGLLDVATESVTLDQTIDRGDLYELVQRFEEMKPDEIESFTLPVRLGTGAGGASVVFLEDKPAERIFNVFRGLPPGAVTEAEVTVNVLNGTGAPFQARDVSRAVAAVGFVAGRVGDASGQPVAQSTIRYPPGSEGAAEVLARHLNGPVALVADGSLVADTVTLVTGSDFTTVTVEPKPATTTTIAPATTAPPTTVDDGTGTTGTTGTSAPTTTVIGITPGETPEGVAC